MAHMAWEVPRTFVAGEPPVRVGGIVAAGVRTWRDAVSGVRYSWKVRWRCGRTLTTAHIRDPAVEPLLVLDGLDAQHYEAPIVVVQRYRSQGTPWLQKSSSGVRVRLACNRRKCGADWQVLQERFTAIVRAAEKHNRPSVQFPWDFR
jgi:hypothetical protein